ncbi:MAG TPA: Txe/YoeB family addiction module toxin [Bacteroidales bacterium]|jgi:toxin YoeB|nr:Txe/YoeB family addiction module toxin [Bacteroidales bacterium]
MQVELTPKARQDIDYWRSTNNAAILKRIELLFDAILQNPYKGIGKPEALKYQLSGKWSRRITNEHRFVYAIEGDTLRIYSLKGHYW